MPVCICNKKVERVQEAIQCKICNKLLHAQCCDIKVCDIELIKSYKCKNCLAVRRASLSSSPAVPMEPPKKTKELSNIVNNESQTQVVVVDKNIFSNTDAVVSNNNNKKLDFDQSAVNVDNIKAINLVASNTTSKVATQIPTDVTNESFNKSSSVSLIELYKEVLAVKESNSKLINFINKQNIEIEKLKNANVDLKKSVTSLENQNIDLKSLIKNVHSDLKTAIKGSAPTPLTLSPKRKKVKSVNRISDKIASSDGLKLTAHTNSKTYVVVPSVSQSVPTFAEVANQNNVPSIANIPSPVNAPSAASLLPSFATTSKASKNVNIGENWTTVENKRTNKNSVAGTNISDELDVFAKFRWIHLSSFKSTVSCDDIIKYISNHSNINAKNFICHKLVKRDENLDGLRFVNFKLGVSTAYYKKMFDSTLWPANIVVRPFIFLSKEKNSKLDQNASKIVI